jgi:hypothetical protein
VHLEGLLIVSVWVDRYGMNCTRFNNDALDGLKGFERTAAIDILALVIALFGIATQITA